MGTTVSITFPLGRYHATPWDGGANTSEVEWPPSPWRLLRALIATWYSRWPELPSVEIERILANLGTPDAYRTPPAQPGSTRHYMPDVAHTSRETSHTDQVIDAFLAIPPGEPLLVHWSAELTETDRATFGKLVELMPYLGRSESICIAELIHDEPLPDATWWRLGESGTDVREAVLLAPDGPVDRIALEATTVATRKARRLLPTKSRKVAYGVHEVEATPKTSAGAVRFTTLRFDLASAVPVRARNAVLVCDAMHGAIAHVITNAEGALSPGLLGVDASGTHRTDDHAHMHVFALPRNERVRPFLAAGEPIDSVIVWVPEAMDDEAIGIVQSRIRHLSVPTYLEGDMATQHLLVGPSGSAPDVLGELAERATTWGSLMPYLPVRHRKRGQQLAEHITDDIRHECRYRGLDDPADVSVIDDPAARREIVQFRRRRGSERMNRQRSGVYVRLQFARPVPGPLALGQLSHFGFGLFVPLDRSDRFS